MAKKKHVPVITDITEKYSIVHLCKHKGQNCLQHYIKTRYHQPDKCLNCLRELGTRDKYQILHKNK
jgi:hypothetical protein